MKILHTEWMKSIGGQAKRVLQELEAIKEFGFFPYLAASKNSWIFNEAKKRGINVIEVEFKGAFDIKNALILHKFIKDNQIDIIHSHSSKDSYAALLAAKLAKIKFIRSRHMDLTKKPGLIYKLSDAIITTGSKIKNELIAYGIKSPIYSIPSYPDRKKFFPSKDLRYKTREKLGLKALSIGALTGIKRDKRPDLILKSLKDKEVDIVVAGVSNDKKYQNEFNKIVNNKVKYIGYTEPNEFLNAIDIYACPSKKEGVPQSIMQAMMVGLPVVSMDIGSIRDLNINNNILLAKDIDEFKSHLLTLIDNKELREELGKKNRNLAKKYFNEEVFKSELKRVYQSL